MKDQSKIENKIFLPGQNKSGAAPVEEGLRPAPTGEKKKKEKKKEN